MTAPDMDRRQLLKGGLALWLATSMAGCSASRDERAVGIARSWLEEKSGDYMARRIVSALESAVPTLRPIVSLVDEDIHEFVERHVESLSWTQAGGPVYEGKPYRAVWFETGRETETLVLEERNMSEVEREARYAGDPPEDTNETMTVPGGKGEFYSKLYFSVYVPSGAFFWEEAQVNQLFVEELRLFDVDVLAELGIGDLRLVDKGLHRPSGAIDELL